MVGLFMRSLLLTYLMTLGAWLWLLFGPSTLISELLISLGSVLLRGWQSLFSKSILHQE